LHQFPPYITLTHLALLLPDKLDTYPQLIPTVRIGPLGVLVQVEF